MKSIFIIGHHDIRVFLKDKTAFLWLLGIPLAFMYFMSFSSRAPSDPKDAQPAILVENLDAGFMGALFLEELGNQGVRPITEDPNNHAKKGLRIPVDFSALILAKQEVEMEFFDVSETTNPNDLKADLVEANLLRTTIAFNSYLLEHATNRGQKPVSEAGLRRLMKKENPVQLESKFAGRKPIPVGFNMSVPGIMVMYVLMNLVIFGASGVSNERKTGILKRMSIQPVTKTELVFGKMYGLMLLGTVQICGYLLFAQYLFKVNIGDQLGGILLTMLLFAWVSASFGLLLGFLIKSHDKVIGVGILLSIPMAALGGCWFPMEFTPDSFQMIGHLVPSAWAMDSLHQLITFGGGLESIVTPSLVLVGYGVVLNILAARFFRV